MIPAKKENLRRPKIPYIELKTLHKRLGIIFAVATAAVVIIPEDPKREIVTLLWTNTVSVPPLPLSVIAVVLLSIFYVVNLLLYNISSRETAAWQLSKAADYTFPKTQKMKETDIATGIPNQIKLAADLKFQTSLAKGGKQSQLIMIDLDNFRKLNQLYNHQKGDEVISYVAQSIHNTMRRNEEIYRHSAGFVPPMDYTFRRIYRKYAGGDEFIFLISGDETEALGFLVRLQISLSRNSPLTSQAICCLTPGHCNSMPEFATWMKTIQSSKPWGGFPSACGLLAARGAPREYFGPQERPRKTFPRSVSSIRYTRKRRLSSINRIYDYEKGDRVIKDFARSIFNTMRRDEHIYKNLIRGENDAPIKSKVNRCRTTGIGRNPKFNGRRQPSRVARAG